MKKVILLVYFMPFMAYGQLVENFETGNSDNWTQSTYGRWEADSSGKLSGFYSLHHIFDNPDAGCDQAGIPLNTLHPSEGTVNWSFLIRHGYDPSSSNNWSVFLMSDTDPATDYADGNTHGYAIGVNLAGYDDTLRLWKIYGDEVTPIVTCGINWQARIGSSDPVRLTVNRTIAGVWTVSVTTPQGSQIGSASGTDNDLFKCEWFIIRYEYSSSRDRLLWFDDLLVEGVFYADNKVPVVKGCKAVDKNSIQIILSDQPSDNFNAFGNFILDPGGEIPVSVTMETPLIHTLKFTDELNNRTDYLLKIKELCNRNGICENDIRVPFTAAWVGTGDIIISEIMADPLPEISLPAKEYLEITNRTDYSFNLKNWRLSAGGQDYSIPDINIESSESLILCSAEDTSLFSPFGRTIGMRQFPVLTDAGKELILYDSDGTLIHGVKYSSAWYSDDLKSNGGWSLEMIDSHYPFFFDGNWKASVSRSGGTPGKANSVAGINQDSDFRGIVNVFAEDSIDITVIFSEPVFAFQNLKDSVIIDAINPSSVCPADRLHCEFSVRLKRPLERGKIYNLEVSRDLKDFACNRITKNQFSFGLTETAEPGDILFNELLFNPLPGDPDYIELFNKSDRIIDASRLQIVSVNDDTGDTSQVSILSETKRLFLPGTYYAVTTDTKRICERYYSSGPDCLFEAASLPSMSDDEGHLILYNRELDMIDEVRYSEKMQSSLLSGYEGVALEKISPGNPSDEALNWHSASESSGWGTPGAPNSVFTDPPVTRDKISFSSTKITPDSNGYEDLLTITFNLTGVSNVVSVTIFDETGRYVRKIAGNLSVGPEGSVIWDGTADDGSLVETGIYIVLITLFDDSGKTNKWKKVCTVIKGD